MRKFLSEQSGRSMIEMLGVLAIIGVLSVGGIAGYSKAMAKYKQNKLGDQVSMLITTLRTLYGNSSDYTDLTTARAVAMGAVDKEMQDGSSGIKNIYGGAIYINAAEDNKSFFVVINGLPSPACTYLASADFGSSVGSGWLSAGAQNADLPSTTKARIQDTQLVDDPDCTPPEGNTNPNICKKSAAVDGKVSVAQGSLPITVAAAAAACNSTSNAVLLEFQ